MINKQYWINSIPASPGDLIRKAKELDSDYGRDGLCLTSGAAEILRNHGHVVETVRRSSDNSKTKGTE